MGSGLLRVILTLRWVLGFFISRRSLGNFGGTHFEVCSISAQCDVPSFFASTVAFQCARHPGSPWWSFSTIFSSARSWEVRLRFLFWLRCSVLYLACFPRQTLTPFFCDEFLYSTGLSDFDLRTRVSEFNVWGFDWHLSFARIAIVFLFDFCEIISKARISFFQQRYATVFGDWLIEVFSLPNFLSWHPWLGFCRFRYGCDRIVARITVCIFGEFDEDDS